MGNPRSHWKSNLKMGLELLSFIGIKGCRSKAFSTCLCLGLFGMLEEPGLGEPFGKASSANTTFVSSRFVPITSRRPWVVERWLRHSSEAWPYEALKRGLPRPFAKRKKLGGKVQTGIDQILKKLNHIP
jgi:hypothetical protein